MFKEVTNPGPGQAAAGADMPLLLRVLAGLPIHILPTTGRAQHWQGLQPVGLVAEPDRGRHARHSRHGAGAE